MERIKKLKESSKQKLKRLIDILKEMESVVIAFSGGVDSSLLLKVALDILGKKNVLAVTARSGTYPKEEYKEAKSLIKKLGANHLIIYTHQLKNENFRKNPLNRCFYCKDELFRKLRLIAKKRGFKFVLDGSNYGDQLDYRPGSFAAKKWKIRSPLGEARLSKKEIRELAKFLGLPNWNKPSQACLSSRIPYYLKITPDKLRLIEEGEKFLRKMGFKQVRLRHHQNIARIEVDKEEMTKFFSDNLRDKITKKLKKLGFKYISLDLEGYRTGSMNIIKSSSFAS